MDSLWSVNDQRAAKRILTTSASLHAAGGGLCGFVVLDKAGIVEAHHDRFNVALIDRVDSCTNAFSA